MEKVFEGIGLFLFMLSGCCLDTVDNGMFALIVGIMFVGMVFFGVGYLSERREWDEEDDFYDI